MGRRAIVVGCVLVACGACGACGGGPRGGAPGPDDDWVITATGSALAVPLSSAQPEAHFIVTATMAGAAALATSEVAAVAITLDQPAALATHAVAWPLRNEFCHRTAPEGYCRTYVKWQELTVADAACDDAGTCVARLTVTVTANDPSAVPPDVTGLALGVSGYWRGAAEPVDGTADAVPPPDSAFTITLAAVP